MSQKTLLSYFWDLASTSETTRIDAAVRLINHLRSKSKTKERTHDEEGQRKDSDDLSYTLERLIKGLGSSRKAARQGFAMALTEVVMLFDHITVEHLMKEMEDALAITKSCSTQEERDAYFGQIFGLATLGRAVCLSKQCGNANIKKSSIRPVIERLKELLAKKSYLQEICYKAMVDIIAMLKFSEFQEHVLPVLESDIKCSWEKCSPDALVLVLATWRLFKDDIGHKTFKKSWKSSHLDSIENYTLQAKILQNSHNSHPRVHYVWEEVFHLVLNSPRSDFGKFWKTVVDENLFQTSHERKFLGFKLLEKVLPMLSVEQVETVFSPQLMHCLFNSLSHTTNYLYSSTKHMIEGIGKIVVQKGKQSLIAEIIKQLLGRNGNVCFDATTKCKAVENLIPELPAEDLPSFVTWMKDVFVTGTTNPDENSRKNVEKTREGMLGLCLSLVRCKHLVHTKAWILDAVYFVFENAYFTKMETGGETNGSEHPKISHRTRALCHQRFNSILGELASLSDKSKTSAGVKRKDVSTVGQQKTAGVAEDGRLWISHVVYHAKSLLKSPEFKVTDEQWTEDVHGIFNKTMKVVRKLEQQSDEHALENQAFVLLFLYVGVQLFSEPQQAQEILEELFQCYNKVKSQLSDGSREADPPWIDVVTEILLSFLTEASNLRRQVVDQVFNIIVPHLTSSSLTIILEAVDPRNGLNEDSALQVEAVSDSENDEEMESADEEENKEKDASDDSDEEDVSGDNDNDSDDNEEQGSVDPLFKVDLQAALGDALANDEDEGDETEETDNDLDDEAMMNLDDALSEVFKQHLKAKDDKKKTKDAKKSILHFKLRVLDLVEILIKKQPSSVLILELMQPLLNIIRDSLSSKDFVTLGERTQGLFKKRLCAIKEHPKLSPDYIESVHSNIEILLKQAMKAPSVTMVTLMSTGCLFLIRQLRGETGEETEKTKKKREDGNDNTDKSEFGYVDFARLQTAYCEALKNFMLYRNTHLHPLLFQDLINRFPVIGWCLAEDLVGYITQGINNFRKIQACTMLTQLLNKKISSYMKYIERLAEPLQEAFYTTFDQVSSSEAEMRAKHLRQILKLATRYVKILQTEPNLRTLVDVDRLQLSLDSVLKSRTVDRARDLENLINCLKSEIAGESTNGHAKSKKSRKRRIEEEIAPNFSVNANTQNGDQMMPKKSKKELEVKSGKKKKKMKSRTNKK